MTYVCIAELETPNFSFRAYGQTISAARMALFEGLRRHAKTHNLPDGWPSQYIEYATVWEAALGAAYRDYCAL